MDELCQPMRGELSIPNIKYYRISFEMTKLVRFWVGTNIDLDGILIEQELTSPLKPIEVLAQTLKIM